MNGPAPFASYFEWVVVFYMHLHTILAMITRRIAKKMRFKIAENKQCELKRESTENCKSRSSSSNNKQIYRFFFPVRDFILSLFFLYMHENTHTYRQRHVS